jgi:hypothetical protein
LPIEISSLNIKKHVPQITSIRTEVNLILGVSGTGNSGYLHSGLDSVLAFGSEALIIVEGLVTVAK